MTASLQLLLRKLLKITCISNTGFSMVFFSQQGQMTFYHGGHPEWYAALEQQLGLRLG
jgi:hypothetical protein